MCGKTIRNAALAGLLGLAANGPVSADALSAQELLPTLAVKQNKSIAYRETRYSPLLKKPLSHTGQLRYRPPDTLEKQALEPPGQTYRIEADQMIVIGQDGKSSPRIALSGQPALAGLAASLRAMMQGDLAGLQRAFRVELLGERRQWLLALLPRDARVGELLSTIRMHGNDTHWQSVELIEASGDRVVIEFIDTPVPADDAPAAAKH